MRVLRVRRVADKYGVSVPTIWRWAKNDPTFPKPVRIGSAVTGWIESEVDKHIELKIAEDRGTNIGAHRAGGSRDA